MPRRSALRSAANPAESSRRASVLIHGLYPRIEAAVRLRAREWADVITAETGGDLVQHVRSPRSPVLAVLLGRDELSPGRIPTLVRTLRAARVSVPILAVCRSGPAYSAEICALGAAGVQELIFEDAEEPFSALRHIVTSAARQCASDVVLVMLGGSVPERVRPFVEQCLGRGGSRPISDISRSLGRDRSQLLRYCQQAGYPSPMETRGWCRLMLAAHLLESTPRTAESIADELDFASVTSLRNLLRRYVDVTTNELRSRGLRLVIDSFHHACARGPRSSPVAAEA